MPIYQLKKQIKLESGFIFPKIKVAYSFNLNQKERKNEITGSFDREKPLVLICHPLTMNLDYDVYWKELLGEKSFFNPNDFNILSTNLIGSNYGSTNPLSINPETGTAYLKNFPTVSIKDQVDIIHQLLDENGLAEIEYIIGGSLGAMVAQQYAISYPEDVKNLISISAPFKIGEWAKAFNETQRDAIELDPSFGTDHIQAGKKGMELARKMATISYSSPQDLENRKEVNTKKERIAYLEYQALDISKRFNAYSYYFLTKTMDTHNIASGFNSIEEALQKLKANVLFISIHQDYLFPKENDIPYLANLNNYEYHIIRSEAGHDGFLKESRQIADIIKKTFQNNKKTININ